MSSWLILTIGITWAVVAAFGFCLMAAAGRPTPSPPSDEDKAREAVRPHGNVTPLHTGHLRDVGRRASDKDRT